MKYKKPIITIVDDCTEGVYMSSGSIESSGKCQSKYTHGIYHKPTSYNIHEGFLVAYGCSGCPANWNDGKCHKEKYTNEILKPSWEVELHSATDTHW